MLAPIDISQDSIIFVGVLRDNEPSQVLRNFKLGNLRLDEEEDEENTSVCSRSLTKLGRKFTI